ncbi:MAG: tartrate dehydrogenase [Pseudarcicella sp.]|nr:tartrate dehydrogenase [Pseudarcicella sp.]
MKTYKIAVINGDGIGNEIVPAGVEVLQAAASKFGFKLETQSFDFGAKHYLAHGTFMPEGALEEVKSFDAVYFGAVGLPAVDDTLPFKLFTNVVRTQFKQYVNYRPVKLLAGVESPLRYKSQKDIDFVVIRENNEGEFVQNGKILYPDEPQGMATDTSVFTRTGIEKIAHYSFQLSRKRRKKVTNVTKSNTMINTLAYWDKVIQEVADQYPDVEYGKMYIDAATANFVLKPEIFDVVLTTNMLGDILSDLGGAILGSLGYGGSGNICPEGTFPSMFEPIHGSAPDIAGKNIANPIGQILSGVYMLQHLGENEAADAIEKAINSVTASGLKSADTRGTASTSDVSKAVIAAL